MKRFLRAAIAAATLATCSESAFADLSFSGNLAGDNDVKLFSFTLVSTSDVSLRTWSYAGGTNAAGDLIAAGGFDPIVSLFFGSGNPAILLDANDDGLGVPVDSGTGFAYDALLESFALPAGTYTVALTQFANFAIGPTLGDGFLDAGVLDFDGRTSAWALDILMTGSTPVPLPGTLALLISGLVAAVATRRFGSGVKPPRRESMTSLRKVLRSWMQTIAALALAAIGVAAQASSHREALAILNEPCADNTDTYAWVQPGTHDKLFLIMNFNPLHEPGQGNQGLRACNGYRYQFHVAVGTSLADKYVYRVEFKNTLNPEALPNPSDPLGGGNELLWQLTGGTETMKVTRILRSNRPIQIDEMDPTRTTVLANDVAVLPNNHGPQTDRLVYGLGPFQGYDSGNPTSREVGLYDQTFVDRFIHNLTNGGRIIAGQFDDPYQLDEKGIFDLVNLNSDDLGGIPGARRPPGKDVFTGFNVFSIAIEIPIVDIFPTGIPHNGTLIATSTDSLLRVYSTINRQRIQTVDATNIITGLKGAGDWVQVGRNALPLFNAGLVGTQRQTLYLHTAPDHDVTNFGADILFPVLVRDAEALGIYRALGVPAATVTTLKGPRQDIITAINLGRPIPVADGSTGDVITLDAAVDSSFPNGRRLGGGTAPNRNQVNVNSVLISLIVAGNPAAGLAKGVEVNDKDYLPRFPFLAPAHQGLLQGHGGINVPTVPNIPVP